MAEKREGRGKPKASFITTAKRLSPLWLNSNRPLILHEKHSQKRREKKEKIEKESTGYSITLIHQFGYRRPFRSAGIWQKKKRVRPFSPTFWRRRHNSLSFSVGEGTRKGKKRRTRKRGERKKEKEGGKRSVSSITGINQSR